MGFATHRALESLYKNIIKRSTKRFNKYKSDVSKETLFTFELKIKNHVITISRKSADGRITIKIIRNE